MRCPDCKDTGRIQLLTSVVPCGRCGGGGGGAASPVPRPSEYRFLEEKMAGSHAGEFRDLASFADVVADIRRETEARANAQRFAGWIDPQKEAAALAHVLTPAERDALLGLDTARLVVNDCTFCACREDDVAPGSVEFEFHGAAPAIALRINGEDYVAFRRDEGSYAAITPNGLAVIHLPPPPPPPLPSAAPAGSPAARAAGPPPG